MNAPRSDASSTHAADASPASPLATGDASAGASGRDARHSGWVLHMPRWVRNVAAIALVLLLALATWSASRQAPHPDMFRPIGLWDVKRLDWWAYPLERNTFKRMVVRGDLNAVFALPEGDHVWAVGSGGLILHSGDGGVTWEQQRPVKPIEETSRRAAIDWLGWMTAAHAQESKGGDVSNQSPLNPAAQRVLPVERSKDASQTAAPVAPTLSVDGAKTDSSSKGGGPLDRGATREPSKSAAPTTQPPSSKAPAVSTSAAPRKAPPAIESPAVAPAASAAASSPTAAPPARDLAGTPDLHALYFVSASTGWAVGDAGTILATSDGGRTWLRQDSRSNAPLRDVHFTTDGLQGWAIGAVGTILVTRDGGGSWSAISRSDSAWLLALHFAADGIKGWAVGRGGMIRATNDGGRSWTGQTSATGESLNRVRFAADGKQGWAVGDVGTLLTTVDGGSTWVKQTDSGGTQAHLKGLHVASDLRSWAVGSRGTIITRRSDESSWLVQTSGTKAQLKGVHFAADALRGWAVGDEGTILSTHDGGNTWQATTSGSRANFTDLHITANGLGSWAVGEDGTILASGDGGKAWVPQRSGTAASLRALHVAGDASRAWIVGDEGTILTTRDGGSSWVAYPLGRRMFDFLSGIDIADDGLRGWIVGFVGMVLTTQDGGSTWIEQTAGSDRWLQSVHFQSDGLRGWAAGSAGVVLATRDGGRTWETQTEGLGNNLFAVRFATDGTRGWAVGLAGTILSSSDSGTKWAVQASGTRADLTALHVATDGLKAWSVGNDGTIVATRDSGRTWITQTSGSKARLSGVRFSSDALNGLIVGEAGTVLATTDGGTTWTPIAEYRRYWAPWYFAAVLALSSLLAGLIAFAEPKSRTGSIPSDLEPANDGGAATILRSDQPVLDKSADRLGYRAAVEALSSFIRNRATEPRVTIAITGEWGSGKSSIMRMLQKELDRDGYRTAWFNAWHQQQEGQQLSALFNTVRRQAVPRVWSRQFIGAFVVRWRLIWGRGVVYKAVAVASAAGLALLAGDLSADGLGAAWSNVRVNFAHHVLQQQRTAITGASLAKLDPTRKPAVALVPAAPASGIATVVTPVGSPPGTSDVCPEKLPPELARKKTEPVRLAVYCDLKRNFVWDQGEDGTSCGVDRPEEPNAARRCIFDSAADLIATLNARGKHGVLALWPSEVAAVRAAAETLPPPPMFRWLEGSLVGGLAGLLALLFTKGVSVYGLQLLARLRGLLALGEKDKTAGKEAAGTIERYRAEFGLLCDALDGRLVIFIDDLDRCTPATVNGMLEMTNYLVDVGRCFVVIGAAVERVKLCITSPVDGKYNEAYANEYLRKLIHIEMPVPLRRAELEALLRDRPADPATPATRWDRLSPATRRSALFVGGAAVTVLPLVLVFQLGIQLHKAGDGRALPVLSRYSAQAEPPGTGASAPTANTASTPLASAPATVSTPPKVGLDAPGPAPWPIVPALIALAAVGVALGLRWSRRHQDRVVLALGGAIRSSDSDRFMHALRIWNPVIVEYDPTPRHVKRFYNRARLFASYESEEAQAMQQAATDDASLVAMAALHHIQPEYLERLRKLIEDAEALKADVAASLPGLPATLGPAFGTEPQTAETGKPQPAPAMVRCFVAAWERHLGAFRGCPSALQVQRFAERVSGIHVR